MAICSATRRVPRRCGGATCREWADSAWSAFCNQARRTHLRDVSGRSCRQHTYTDTTDESTDDESWVVVGRCEEEGKDCQILLTGICAEKANTYPSE